MKPIETIYKGFRFRSRLEARWAVFYDTLGIKWEYEKEGYDLGKRILYLPDFYIPHLDCWIEIKGEKSPGCAQKCEDLSEQSRKNVYIFYGTIKENREWPKGEVFYGEYGGAWDNCQWWCECPTCRKFGIQFEGRAGRICHHTEDEGPGGLKTDQLCLAYDMAQQARFEHGK